MRKWINLVETHHFVGSCVNSFDEDGDCIVGDLPWSTVSDLGYADENAKQISREAFLQNTVVPLEVKSAVNNHSIRYLEHDGVYMLYDEDDDIHYFFV